MREKLLSTLDEIERNLNAISERRLNQIAKMQSTRIMNMYNQPRDELERVAKIRKIKNHKTMSKEELIILL